RGPDRATACAPGVRADRRWPRRRSSGRRLQVARSFCLLHCRLDRKSLQWRWLGAASGVSLPLLACFMATPAKDICWYRGMSTSKTCMVVFMRLSEKYAVPEELALLYDFVNTLDRRRFVERGVVHAGGDELATPRRMEAWMRKHHLPASGKH